MAKMTKEEAIEDFRHSIAMSKLDLKFNKKNMSIEREIMVLNSIARNEMAIKALEQEPKTGQFAEWVAREIFDDMWEYNKDSFAEIACRKLAKLGIVREKGDEWELVEPQESEDK